MRTPFRVDSTPGRRSAGGVRERRGSAMIKLKRAYEKPSRDDGSRIPVKRLWPRGLSKGRPALDLCG